MSAQIEAVAWAAVGSWIGPFRLIRVGLATRLVRDERKPGADEEPEPNGRTARAVVRGLLLAVPFLLVFGTLFMSADRIFADLVRDLVDFDYQEILSHLVVTAILSWLACGFLTGFLAGTRLVGLSDALGARPAVGIVELGIALALVDSLFLLFVSIQFRYLFGGGDLVEVTPGLTYAEYVRQGFGQLALAGALVLPSLLAADWLFRARHPRDVLVFRVLGGLLLLLLMVIIASALQRVRAYQTAYGLTESRFYAAAFVGWLTLLTAWFAATVLRGRRERFAFPALSSGFAFLGLLAVVNPDAWIARTNLARAHASAAAQQPAAEIDAQYLVSLSADAVPVLVGAVADLPAVPRCELAAGLLRKWGPDTRREPDWRTWNWPVSRARSMVSAEAGTLRAMASDTEACSTGDG